MVRVPVSTAQRRPLSLDGIRRLIQSILDGRTYGRILYLLLALPLGVAEFTFLVTAISFGFGTAITLIGIPVLVGSVYAWRWIAELERGLIGRLTGVEIASPYRPDPVGGRWWTGFAARLADPATWKDLAFLLLQFPLGILSFSVTVAVFGFGLRLLVAPVYYEPFADGDWIEWLGVDTLGEALALMPLGALILFLGIPALGALGRLYGWLALQLLGSNADPELTAQVTELQDARSRIIAAADDERRRIERDLHDGAQQRLVALALNLRMAEQRAVEGDPTAVDLIRGAGEEANLALKELRDLARGIHPAILTNRGLPAALEDLASRATLPVEVVASPDERLPGAVEAAAYFVVSECLANISKHAEAEAATVAVSARDGVVTVEVSDDGVGGAELERRHRHAGARRPRGCAERVPGRGQPARRGHPRDGGDPAGWRARERGANRAGAGPATPAGAQPPHPPRFVRRRGWSAGADLGSHGARPALDRLAAARDRPDRRTRRLAHPRHRRPGPPTAPPRRRPGDPERLHHRRVGGVGSPRLLLARLGDGGLRNRCRTQRAAAPPRVLIRPGAGGAAPEVRWGHSRAGPGACGPRPRRSRPRPRGQRLRSASRAPARVRRLRLVNDGTLALDDALATASTGDIWLFRGRALADLAIRAVTNSPVNHVGMVVALDDLPPLLWHAELGRSLPDVWTGERQRGVQLHLLGEAVRTWNERYRQRAWVRQLEGAIERPHEDRLMEVIERFDGRPFPTTPGLVRQWATGRLRRRSSSLETIYCAELVATTYQHMGVLPSRRPASWYDPGRFWSGDRIELSPPFALGGEIAVH